MDDFDLYGEENLEETTEMKEEEHKDTNLLETRGLPLKMEEIADDDLGLYGEDYLNSLQPTTEPVPETKPETEKVALEVVESNLYGQVGDDEVDFGSSPDQSTSYPQPTPEPLSKPTQGKLIKVKEEVEIQPTDTETQGGGLVKEDFTLNHNQTEVPTPKEAVQPLRSGGEGKPELEGNTVQLIPTQGPHGSKISPNQSSVVGTTLPTTTDLGAPGSPDSLISDLGSLCSSEDSIDIFLDKHSAHAALRKSELHLLHNQVAKPNPTQSVSAGLDLDWEPEFAGEPLFDLDPETVLEKPWRKPGADRTDYFNYNFDEANWLRYAQRQKDLREFGPSGKPKPEPIPHRTLAPTAKPTRDRFKERTKEVKGEPRPQGVVRSSRTDSDRKLDDRVDRSSSRSRPDERHNTRVERRSHASRSRSPSRSPSVTNLSRNDRTSDRDRDTNYRRRAIENRHLGKEISSNPTKVKSAIHPPSHDRNYRESDRNVKSTYNPPTSTSRDPKRTPTATASSRPNLDDNKRKFNKSFKDPPQTSSSSATKRRS